jgi:hypothetical protein
MAEQFHVKCQDEPHAREVAAQLHEVKVNGASAVYARTEGDGVFAGCSFFELRNGTEIMTSRTDQRGVGFNDLFYMIHTMRSGQHARPGMLWIRSGRSQVVADKVSVAAIAPTILTTLGIRPPEYMKEHPLPV